MRRRCILSWLLLHALCASIARVATAQVDPHASVPPTPAVIWYAPFLSGGGYCSEAHSYVTSIAAALRSREDRAIGQEAQEASDGRPREQGGSHSGETVASSSNVKPFSLFVTQHGDSFNAAFIRDIPDDMRALLEEVSMPVFPYVSWLFRMRTYAWIYETLTRVYAFASQLQRWIEEREFHWRLLNHKIAIAICHSEPGAWHPARYTTSRCPPEGALYKVGRTMFETDRVPSGWSDRMNNMDEIWVPTRYFMLKNGMAWIFAPLLWL